MSKRDAVMTGLLITTSDRLLDGAVAPTGRRLWYFGASSSRWEALSAAFPQEVAASRLGEVLAGAAERLAEPFRNLDAALGLGAEDRLAFDCSPVGARGRFDSDLFLDLCRWDVLRQALGEGQDQVVAVDDPALGHALAALAVQFEPVVDLPPAPSSPWLPIRRLVGAVLRQFRRGILLRRLRRSWPLEREGFAHADVVVVLWGRARSFPAAATHDMWFGDLPGELAARGYRVAFVIYPVDWVDEFAEIARNALSSGFPVLFPQECVGILDVIRAGLAAWRSARAMARPDVSLDGLPIGPLVRLAVTRARASWSAAGGRVDAHVADRLARFGSVPVLLHVYEGQSWEKALRHRVRSALPDTRICAVQHMPGTPLYFSFFPSDTEISSGSLPDHLFAIGGHAYGLFRSRGYPSDRLSIGGALRYSKIGAIQAGVEMQAPTALCCVGVDMAECRELVWKAATAVARYPEVNLIVNFNPLAEPEVKQAARSVAARAMGDRAESSLTFSDDRVTALLARCGLVIYADTNASYEAYAAGCRMVHLSSSYGLGYDKLPDGWSIRCRDADDVADALGAWIRDGAPVVAATDRHRDVGWTLPAAGRCDAFIEQLERFLPGRESGRRSKGVGG